MQARLDRDWTYEQRNQTTNLSYDGAVVYRADVGFEDLPPVPITHGGVVDPAHAVGRDADAADVLCALSGGESVALPGERRHGKTVLSRIVEERGHALDWTVVTRSVEGTRSVEEVTEELARDLLAVLPPLERVKAWLGSRAEFSARGVRIESAPLSLEDVLAEACSHTDHLLLILDELPVCARALERRQAGSGLAFLHQLRRLRQMHEPLTMLCLGSIGFHHVVPDLEGAINDMHPHSLGPLAPDGALELAVRLLKGTDIPLATRRVLAPQMATASEGVPYYLHLLAGGCRRRHAAGATLDGAPVDAMVTAAIEDPDDGWDLKHYVTRLTAYYGPGAPAAGAILDLIARGPYTADEVRRGLAAAADDIAGADVGSLAGRLEQDHYLVRAGQTLRFRSEIVRRAWLRWRP